jgi:hypothetical protein
MLRQETPEGAYETAKEERNPRRAFSFRGREAEKRRAVRGILKDDGLQEAKEQDQLS